MFACVATAEYLLQAGIHMLLRQFQDRVFVFAGVRSNGLQTPGAAEIQSIEVNELAIGMVFYLSYL